MHCRGKHPHCLSWTGEQPHLCQDIFVFASPVYYPFPPRPLTARAGGPGFAALRTLFSPVFLSERPSGAPDLQRPGRKALPPHALDINPNSKSGSQGGPAHDVAAGLRPVDWGRRPIVIVCHDRPVRASSGMRRARPGVLGGRTPGFSFQTPTADKIRFRWR